MAKQENAAPKSRWFFTKNGFQHGDPPSIYEGHRVYERRDDGFTPEDSCAKHVIFADSEAEVQKRLSDYLLYGKK